MMLSGLLTTFAAAWLAVMPIIARSGFVPYDMVLEPTDMSVHYNDGFIRAPGFIDLGMLTFAAISEAMGGYTSLDTTAAADHATGDDDSGAASAGDAATPPRHHKLEATKSTFVDIVIFYLPSSCAHSKKGCDWTELGVGNRSEDGAELRWCCTSEAAALGICAGGGNFTGRLIVDDQKFNGKYRSITVPREGAISTHIRYGKIEETKSGTYVVLFANCDEAGREIFVSGASVWKSKHGYLPGDFYGFMFFFSTVTLVYFGLLAWYGRLMYVNEEHRIEIERWIFLAIALGLLEMIFRTGDFFVWNADGSRSSYIIWIGILAGVWKQGISRCLIVMVSLGWGVVRDSLGSMIRPIIVLGALYICCSAVFKLMVVFALEDMTTLSDNQEEDIFGVAWILYWVVLAIGLIFFIWILDALNNTMLYLENMNQTRKLDRYLKVRCILLFSFLFATITFVFRQVDSADAEGIVAAEHAWVMDAAAEVNYLFVLIGVALLWKPNPNAREYAYVMELPAAGTDGENELELAGVVPSALDSDDDFGTEKNGGYGKNGIYDDTNGNDGRFQIS